MTGGTRLLLLAAVMNVAGVIQAQSTMPTTQASDELWYSKPLRIVQTLLREPDVQDYNAEEVVGYLKAVNANCIVMNGGGVIDFFRHDHEMANPNSFLDTEDIFGQIVSACHREGMRVIVRVDFRGVEDARYKKHPDWFSLTSDKSPKIVNKLHVSCFNGSYRNVYGIYFIRYLLEKYDVDGIWYNAPHSDGTCYCRECQKKYKEATGAEIPRIGDSDEEFLSPKMATYRELKNEWALEHVGRVREVIKSFGEDKILLAEIFGFYGGRTAKFGGIDLYTISPFFDFLIGKAFVGDGQDVAYSGSTIRFLKSLAPEKQTVLLASTNRNENRLISENPLDVQCWFWETVAAGSGIWNSTSSGKHPDVFLDKRNARLETEAFQFLKENGGILASLKPVADVKLYYSAPTRELFQDEFAPPIQGAERVLLERHVPYTFLPDRYFDGESLEGVKVLILPSVKALSENEMDRIRDYVRSGGTAIADLDTSLFDEKGNERKDFGLADLFGCSYSGESKETDRGSYHHIRQRHEILRGYEETELLLNGGKTLSCSSTAGTAIATLIPTVHSQPPERAWIPKIDSDQATVVVNTFGKGKVIYFAHSIMRLCMEDGHKDFSGLLGNALDYCLGEDKSLETNAPASLRLSLLRNDQGQYVLSFVNHSASPYRPATTLIPVHDIDVKLRLHGQIEKTHRILKSEAPVQVEFEGDKVRIHLDRIDQFASIAMGVEPTVQEPAGQE